MEHHVNSESLLEVRTMCLDIKDGSLVETDQTTSNGHEDNLKPGQSLP
jgi:hypothetical protein